MPDRSLTSRRAHADPHCRPSAHMLVLACALPAGSVKSHQPCCQLRWGAAAHGSWPHPRGLLRRRSGQAGGARQRLELAAQMVAGLRAAHAAGVAHLDVKAGNMLVSDEGGAPLLQVADFGLAVLLDPATKTAALGRCRCASFALLHWVKGSGCHGSHSYLTPCSCQLLRRWPAKGPHTGCIQEATTTRLPHCTYIHMERQALPRRRAGCPAARPHVLQRPGVETQVCGAQGRPLPCCSGRGTPGYALPSLAAHPVASEAADAWGALLVIHDMFCARPAGDQLGAQFEALTPAQREAAEEQLPPTHCSELAVLMSAQALGMLSLEPVRLMRPGLHARSPPWPGHLFPLAVFVSSVCSPPFARVPEPSCREVMVTQGIRLEEGLRRSLQQKPPCMGSLWHAPSQTLQVPRQVIVLSRLVVELEGWGQPVHLPV